MFLRDIDRTLQLTVKFDPQLYSLYHKGVVIPTTWSNLFRNTTVVLIVFPSCAPEKVYDLAHNFAVVKPLCEFEQTEKC